MGAPQDDSHSTDDAGDRPRISTNSDPADGFAPTAISVRGPDTMSGDLIDDQTVATSGHTVSLYFDGGARRNIPPPGATLAAGGAAPASSWEPTIEEPSLVMGFAPPPPIRASRWRQIAGITSLFLALIIVGVALGLLLLQRDPSTESGAIGSLAVHLQLDPLLPPAPGIPAKIEDAPEEVEELAAEPAPLPAKSRRDRTRPRSTTRRAATAEDEVEVEAPPVPKTEPPKELAPEPEAPKETGSATVNIVVRRGGKPLPAEIVIDGVSAAQAPARLELSSGKHTVEIRTPGSPVQKRVITLSDGQSTRVLFDL